MHWLSKSMKPILSPSINTCSGLNIPWVGTTALLRINRSQTFQLFDHRQDLTLKPWNDYGQPVNLFAGVVKPLANLNVFSVHSSTLVKSSQAPCRLSHIIKDHFPSFGLRIFDQRF